MERWHDAKSTRDVWLFEVNDPSEWPTTTPWPCAGFGLLLLMGRTIDVDALAARVVSQGLAVACAWGPGSAVVEIAFDHAAVAAHPDETADNVILTTSHPDESLAEALTFFLEVVSPASDRARECRAWCILTLGHAWTQRARTELQRRGARRVDASCDRA